MRLLQRAASQRETLEDHQIYDLVGVQKHLITSTMSFLYMMLIDSKKWVNESIKHAQE